MNTRLENRFSKINPKKVPLGKFIDVNELFRKNVNRGVKRFVSQFPQSLKLITHSSAKISEKQMMQLVKSIGLIKKKEDPREIIGDLIDQRMPYFRDYFLLGCYDSAFLREGTNARGEKAYYLTFHGY